MSFILDALKKSEAERRQGEVPKLQNEPFSPPPRRRPVWPLVLTLALLLNGGVLGWWLLSGNDAPATAESVADEARPVDAGGQPIVAVAAQQRPATKAEPSAADESTLPAAHAPAEPEIVTEVIDETAVRTAVPVSAAMPATIVAKEPNVKPAPATVATVVKPKASAPRPTADAYPPVSELPGNVRSSLPRLDLQLHFFTPDPERRLVRLNGINLRQGGSSGDGLSVVEITQDGVKLAYGGHRFFLPTGRP